MSFTTFTVVLVAAAFHASWNAVVKGGNDKLLTTALVTGAAAFLAAITLPFLGMPAPASWPFIAGSVLFQIGYFILVARIYHIADMSLTYPLMRGTAPLIVALASAMVLREPLLPPVWLGIILICSGVLSMAVARQPGNGKGMSLAFLNAMVIAGYTMIDGEGVRRSGAAAGYTLWIFLLTGIPLIVWALTARSTAFIRYVAANWHYGVIGGIGAVASYGLALWAMTTAPIAVVSALRETSILFGTIITAAVLRESVDRRRIIAACIIAAGAAALRLA